MQGMNEEERLRFTCEVIALLDSWKVKDSDQLKLLGLPDDTRSRQIRGYRQGSAALPDDEQVAVYVDHMMGIADALFTSNPRNTSAGPAWMNRRNSRFKDRTPLNAMLEDGLQMVFAVRVHLDCSYDWHVDSNS